MRHEDLRCSIVSIFEKSQICFEIVRSRGIFWANFYRGVKAIIVVKLFYFFVVNRGMSLLFEGLNVQMLKDDCPIIGDMPSLIVPH